MCTSTAPRGISHRLPVVVGEEVEAADDAAIREFYSIRRSRAEITLSSDAGHRREGTCWKHHGNRSCKPLKRTGWKSWSVLLQALWQYVAARNRMQRNYLAGQFDFDVK